MPVTLQGKFQLRFADCSPTSARQAKHEVEQEQILWGADFVGLSMKMDRGKNKSERPVQRPKEDRNEVPRNRTDPFPWCLFPK